MTGTELEITASTALFQAVDACLQTRNRIVVALDGPCGSGKTTLAEGLAKRYGAAVFHTDDFYLPFARRIEGWQKVPCANMDLQRLRWQVLEPVRAGETVRYRPFSAHQNQFGAERYVVTGPVTVVEGSYSCHPMLAELYDLKVFVTCDSDTRLQRLSTREGENLTWFKQLWIPLEEGYFSAFKIPHSCDLTVCTDEKTVAKT